MNVLGIYAKYGDICSCKASVDKNYFYSKLLKALSNKQRLHYKLQEITICIT